MIHPGLAQLGRQLSRGLLKNRIHRKFLTVFTVGGIVTRLAQWSIGPQLDPEARTSFSKSHMNLTNRLLVAILMICGLHPVEAVKIRVATYNVLGGIGEVGEPGRDEMEAVLARIDADVVSLQEVYSADFSGAMNNLTSLQANLGYPHLFLPTGALDPQTRTILLSKFPFTPGTTKSIVSPPGANDVTRASPAATIDVPGTANDPVVVAAHLKCCSDPDDPFRRAVEMTRIRKHLESLGLDGSDNVFVIGDFNLLGSDRVYTETPTGLPPSYVLGNDISFNVNYYSDPVDYFNGLGLTNPGYRHQDGVTTDTFMGSRVILDYLLVSDAINLRMPMTEIYNSALDSSFPGLPKAGSPLPTSTSGNASDHYPVYGDFELDGSLVLSVEVTPAILDEDSPPASVRISIPSAVATPTVVALQSSDPGEAAFSNSTITIPAGGTFTTIPLTPQLDRISDGIQNLSVLANADGYQVAATTVSVRDADPLKYIFQTSTSTLLETFDNFEGGQSLAAWSDGGVAWKGSDDGSNGVSGARSYNQSLGIIAAAEAEFSTTIQNGSASGIDALSISLDASQWRRIAGGSADKWEVAIERNGIRQDLPDLGFESSPTGTTGPLSPPEVVSRQAFIRGLNLLPNEEFKFHLKAIPGSGGSGSSADVFINEFHYDNTGSDVGEFVEIFVGAGFTGNLSEVSLVLYNGNNGNSYGIPHTLDTFTDDSDPESGLPRLLFKSIAGIQNGSPDGMALIVNGEVREFISYEGSFTAANGPAAGLSSTEVPVSQSAATPVGQRSITRTGAGGVATDFTWEIQNGPHTPGQPNLGQTFESTPQPQGIAIDNIRIIPLLDQDGDLLTDVEEINLGTDPNSSDSDLDGQDDYFESILAGTDPLDSSSYLKPVFNFDNGGVSVVIPSRAGYSYALEFTSDLELWNSTPYKSGTGAPLTFNLEDSERLFIRIRISP